MNLLLGLLISGGFVSRFEFRETILTELNNHLVTSTLLFIILNDRLVVFKSRVQFDLFLVVELLLAGQAV